MDTETISQTNEPKPFIFGVDLGLGYSKAVWCLYRLNNKGVLEVVESGYGTSPSNKVVENINV